MSSASSPPSPPLPDSRPERSAAGGPGAARPAPAGAGGSPPAPGGAPVAAGGPLRPRAASAGSGDAAALRSGIHFGALILAFPLLWLAQSIEGGGIWAAAVCLAGVLFNMLILPRLPVGMRIRREGEGFVNGVWMYPLGLLLAFLLYPPFAVASAWAVLAVGDAAAVSLGRRMPRPVLAWNPRKGWPGLLAFVVAAVPASFVLLSLFPGDLLGSGALPGPAAVLAISLLAAVCGAFLESLKGPLDDNLRVPVGVGLAVWIGAFLLHSGVSAMPPGRTLDGGGLLVALAFNSVLVLAVLLLGFVDLPGALAGGVAGILVCFLAQPSGYLLLVLFVAGGSLLSRVGRRRKEAVGAAEARGGRRGLSNVLANCSVPVLCCFAYLLGRGNPAALLAFAGSLCAALADTASSEIGALSGQAPRLIWGGGEVAHGTNGGVTRLGHLGALGAALIFVAVAWVGGFWRVVELGHAAPEGVLRVERGLLFSALVVLAGLAGNLVDSLLGEVAEGRLPGVGKGAVNFLCTLTGALLAGGLGWLLW